MIYTGNLADAKGQIDKWFSAFNFLPCDPDNMYLKAMTFSEYAKELDKIHETDPKKHATKTKNSFIHGEQNTGKDVLYTIAIAIVLIHATVKEPKLAQMYKCVEQMLESFTTNLGKKALDRYAR